jgi:hypothetical protein
MSTNSNHGKQWHKVQYNIQANSDNHIIQPTNLIHTSSQVTGLSCSITSHQTITLSPQRVGDNSTISASVLRRQFNHSNNSADGSSLPLFQFHTLLLNPADGCHSFRNRPLVRTTNITIHQSPSTSSSPRPYTSPNPLQLRPRPRLITYRNAPPTPIGASENAQHPAILIAPACAQGS